MMWRYLLCFAVVVLSCHSTKELAAPKQHMASANTFQLMPPKIRTDAILFREKTKADLAMDFPDAKIRYTLDGSPVDQQSLLYNLSDSQAGNTITIEQSVTLQAIVTHPDCQPSKVLVQPFYKVSNVFDQANITLLPSADARYAGNGVESLTDLQKGSDQFRGNPRWLGFQKDTVTIQIDFAKETTLESIIVSTLANESAWIFLPGRVEIWEGEEQITFVEKENWKDPSRSGSHFITIPFQKRDFQKMTIKVLSDPLPKGHNGYGYIAWFFVDEIFVVAD
jgi:Chitobiase/beta-hexosaminidase C-terminal domain